jgi:hypothetical protein
MPRPVRPSSCWPSGAGRRFAVLAAAALLGSCGSPPDDSPQRRTEERLVGTWLREYADGTATVRRVLVLGADGHFRELSLVRTGQAAITHAHSGDWLFDGTNLKRHYTQVDGEKPARPMIPFVTFEVRFSEPNEFVGVDNVRRREIHYRRVSEGTLP